MKRILIGATLQIGAGHLGCGMAPSALRIAGLAVDQSALPTTAIE
jgi:arginase